MAGHSRDLHRYIIWGNWSYFRIINTMIAVIGLIYNLLVILSLLQLIIGISNIVSLAWCIRVILVYMLNCLRLTTSYCCYLSSWDTISAWSNTVEVLIGTQLVYQLRLKIHESNRVLNYLCNIVWGPLKKVLLRCSLNNIYLSIFLLEYFSSIKILELQLIIINRI